MDRHRQDPYDKLEDKSIGAQYSGEDVAFLQFTSGSTSAPKGIADTTILHIISR